MTARYIECDSCSPSADDSAYISKISPLVDGGLAAITSTEVLVVNTASLSSTDVSRFDGSLEGLATLSVGDQGRILYCGDSKGLISCFDVRVGRKTNSFNIGHAVTATCCRGHDLAVGTELVHQQAIVSVWDLRTNSMRWHNPENNDDVTAVDFHPTQDNLVLAGGDDGLVSIFDTNIADEEESLVQAINHGPIHKAGFMQNSSFFALSSDHNLAIYPVYSKEDDQEFAPVSFGELRPIVPCEYVIDVVRTGPNFAVATGSHSASRVDIINITDGVRLDLANPVTLEGAHGEEIVRSLVVNDENNVIFSAGEDGQIKAFKPAGASTTITPSSNKSAKGQRKADPRYKPY